MVLNDILTLVKAGYTRDEIAQMEQQETPNANPVSVPTPVPEPEPTPEPTNTQAQVAEPVAQPQPTPTPVPSEPTMAELMQAIVKLTGSIHANAIAQSVIPGGVTQQTPTAEDMLAEIIRPTYKAREEK